MLMAGKAACTLASLHENASKRSILFWLETRLSSYKYLHIIKQSLERRLLSFSLRWNGPCANIPSDSLTAHCHIWEVISLSLIPPSFACVLRGQESHRCGLWGHLVQISGTDKACDTGLATKVISLNQPPSTRWPRNHFLTQHFLLSSTHADSTLYRTNIETNCMLTELSAAELRAAVRFSSCNILRLAPAHAVNRVRNRRQSREVNQDLALALSPTPSSAWSLSQGCFATQFSHCKLGWRQPPTCVLLLCLLFLASSAPQGSSSHSSLPPTSKATSAAS